MPHARPYRRGQTFVELTITILIMGILAAAAFPTYFRSLENYRVQMTVRRVVADLRFARTEAQRSGQSRTVQFDTTNHRYSLLGVADLDDSSSSYAVDLTEDPLFSQLASATFGAASEVTFDRFGRPDAAGVVTIRNGGTTTTISLLADGNTTVP